MICHRCTRSSGCIILKSGCRLLKSGCPILESGCDILEVGCDITESGCDITELGRDIAESKILVLLKTTAVQWEFLSSEPKFPPLEPSKHLIKRDWKKELLRESAIGLFLIDSNTAS